ncbi:hypothetical protein SARC_12527 [Sphaeroforma arctica JP610]|uniref:Uncharacterized protein n=1 Tax=Sphaeroforma arctica JP610 TaxID=667725 RepID=A0A0L0FDT6_9EUKA|nr:hypothetical protein SARC_12527 [Sphaeroforma arctica JP610]KNC74937.1 hypothetical protein SARC_12527 [Sphaeroforma arctica JP610]|eukprot:XP_014148839.1 hypothetical protein SARC_12527 [Sphaeroforma arctica JP610]
MSAIVTILLSALFAGLVAILVTFLIERLGGLVGGVIGSTPSITIPTVIGIALSSNETQDVFNAMTAIPVGLLVTASFLLVWRYLPLPLTQKLHVESRSALWLTLATSLCVWAGFAIISVISMQQVGSVAGKYMSFLCLALMLLTGFLVTYFPTPTPLHQHAHPGHSHAGSKSSWQVLATRGLLAGTATGVTVGISMVNEIAAGVLSSFPSISLTTMVALWLAHGPELGLSAVGSTILGSGSVAFFSLAFGVFIHWFTFNIAVSCVLAYLVGLAYSVAVGLLLYYADKRKRYRSGVRVPSGRFALFDDVEEYVGELSDDDENEVEPIVASFPGDEDISEALLP